MALQVASGEETVQQAAADILLRLRRPHEAIAHLEVVARKRGGLVERVELAKAMDAAGRQREAIAAYQRILPMSPVKAPIYVLMSTSELSRGNREQSLAYLEAALAADPHDGYALLSLASHFPDPDRIAIVERAIAATQAKPLPLYGIPLRFALARLLDHVGDIDRAFATFKSANEIVSRLRPVEEIGAGSSITHLGTALTEASPPEPDAEAGAQPVFVFGMPRSGTTLIEQVIASHPEAAAIGEIELVPKLIGSLWDDLIGRCAQAYLAVYPEGIRRVRRVVDKSLSSWMYLGPILRMFPKARLIHCRRHPLDVCWSAFTELFGDHALAYTYSFEQLARRHRLCRTTVARGHHALPGRILDVRYEELVAEPERIVRQIIDHCGLPFDSACLRPDLVNRTVRTASMSQVRQPIYRSSAGRWQRYGKHLGILQSLLSEEISDYQNHAG